MDVVAVTSRLTGISKAGLRHIPRKDHAAAMRFVVELVFAVFLLFALLRLDWPWPILAVPTYLLGFGLGIPPFSRRIMVRARFLAFLVTFLTSTAFLTWLIAEILFRPFFAEDIIAWNPLLRFLMHNSSLKIFWSALIGLLAPTVVVACLLVPYGLVVGQNMFGHYEQYKGHEREAALSAVSVLLGIGRGVWVVNNGQAEVHGQAGEGLARFGGPGILIAQQGHAVILEKGGKVSRIVGSGLTWLEPFERVSMVVPLFGRNEKVTVEQVVTRDRVLIEEFEVLIFHRLDEGPEEEQIRDGQFAYNETILRRVVWSPGGGDWRGGVRSLGESAVRDVVGRYDLEQLVPMSENFRARFKNDLKQALNKVTIEAMGVRVVAVDIGKIKIPDEAKRRLLEKWLADWSVRIAQSEREALIRRGEAEAVILKVKEVAWAQAQKQVIEEIAASLQSISGTGKEAAYVVALRALETIERMAGDPATKILLSPEMFMQLRDLKDTIGSDGFVLPARRA
jgi:regulator of protease activity HflC (stomatin/prohibitin superfamily)